MPQPKRSSKRTKTTAAKTTATKRSAGTRRASREEAKPRTRQGKTASTKKIEEEVRKGRSRANNYRNDPKKTRKLVDEAMEKANSTGGPKGALRELWSSLMTLMRLVRAYADGDYRDVPWDTIALAIVAIAYFLLPFDLIPDFIPGAGYVDDAAVIAWVIASVKSDLDDFERWEAERAAAARKASRSRKKPSAGRRTTPAKRTSGGETERTAGKGQRASSARSSSAATKKRPKTASQGAKTRSSRSSKTTSR